MEDLSSNSLSDFADDWVMDQPAEKETAVDQSLPEVVTFPAGDIARPAVVVAEEVFGDGDKAAEEVGEGELEEVVVVEEAVPKRRRRRRTGKRKAVEKSEVPTSPAEVLQRRSRGRQRRAGRAEVSPPFGEFSLISTSKILAWELPFYILILIFFYVWLLLLLLCQFD